MYTFSKLTYLLMLTRCRDFKCGSHNPEKPQEHNQGAGRHSFKHSSPAVRGLGKTAMDESVCYPGLFEFPPGIQRGPARKVAVLTTNVEAFFPHKTIILEDVTTCVANSLLGESIDFK